MARERRPGIGDTLTPSGRLVGSLPYPVWPEAGGPRVHVSGQIRPA